MVSGNLAERHIENENVNASNLHDVLESFLL